MLREIRLQNFKSFGPLTKVPLEPITVIVGPNNSGKSCFLSVHQLIMNALGSGGLNDAINAHGGPQNLQHRPSSADPDLKIEWDGSDDSHYELTIRSGHRLLAERAVSKSAEVVGRMESSGNYVVESIRGDALGTAGRLVLNPGIPMQLTALGAAGNPRLFPEWRGFLDGRLLRLFEGRMRSDAKVVQSPALTSTGEGMPIVLDEWRGAVDAKAVAFDKFVSDCLPEIDDVIVRGAPEPGYKRISVRQKDGQEFDAERVSDGVLFFLAIAMHAVDAPPGAMLLIEEPERSVHPRRIHEIVNLLRQVARERGCQIIMTTHSRVVVDRFRDEPESIVLFRRGETGTEVRRLADLPKLMEALARDDPHKRADPGDMLESGLFNEPFGDLA